MLCDPTWCLVRVQLYGTAERARNGRGKEIGKYRGRGETRGYVARRNTAISLILLLLLISLARSHDLSSFEQVPGIMILRKPPPLKYTAPRRTDETQKYASNERKTNPSSGISLGLILSMPPKS